jgi:GNAT superfamily N-acetyltransferase
MQAFQIEDTWLPLERSKTPLVSPAVPQALAKELVAKFDFDAERPSEFFPFLLPDLPEFGIGLIVGGSGTGKSTLLNTFFDPQTPQWNPELTIADHFDSADEASSKFYAVGLSSVPTWLRPYHLLSNGEKFRADLAIQLQSNVAIDEFTSVVDRTVAKSASKSVGKFIKENDLKNVVFATVHKDVMAWLQPDWIIDTDAGLYCISPKECLRRPELVADIYEVHKTMWAHFAGHHYLDGSINATARCFVAVIEGQPAVFASAITLPSGTLTNAWREHRTVTLPDYQGLGLGVRMSDWVAQWFIQQNKRYYSKTTHPRLGGYRDASPLWKPTSTNHSHGSGKHHGKLAQYKVSDRYSYSHEYIGQQ